VSNQAFEQGAKTAAPLMARVTFYKGSAKVPETPPVTETDPATQKFVQWQKPVTIVP
jgi:hypothetical protein